MLSFWSRTVMVISMLAERGGLPWSLAVTTTQYSDLSSRSRARLVRMIPSSRPISKLSESDLERKYSTSAFSASSRSRVETDITTVLAGWFSRMKPSGGEVNSGGWSLTSDRLRTTEAVVE